MILPIANDLVLRKGLGVTVDSFLAQSRRDEKDPRARVGLRELDGSAPQGRRECVRSTARTGESKFIDDHVAGFIDDHVAGAENPAELPIVEIANCNGDRQAGAKQLLWSVEDGAGAALQPGLSTGREFTGTWVDCVANWSISRSWRRSDGEVAADRAGGRRRAQCQSVAGV